MLEVRVNITLHENQLRLHTQKTRFTVVKAGKRFGKSYWALFELMQAAGLTPGGTFWYVAPTYRHAKDIAWNSLVWMLPRELVRRKVETELYFELTNGARIYLKGAENEDALRGVAIDGLVMDEASYVSPYVWPAILRGQLREGAFAFFISSPNKTGINWYTDFCEGANQKARSGNKEWSYFYFTIYDNPTRSREDIEDIRNSMSDDIWNLEYMAIESAYSGLIFKEFQYTEHVKDILPSNRPYHFRGIDWGIAHPTVCLWGCFDPHRAFNVDDNRVLIYDEYGKSGEIIADTADTIKKMTDKQPIEWTVCDPSMRKRNSQTLRTDADEFNRYGVPVIAGDNRDRGYDITKMFFKRNLIYVHPRCKNLIAELKTVQYADKEGDDYTDTLRYMLLRIHDVTFSGSLFSDVPDPGAKLGNREMSFFDAALFPNRFAGKKYDRAWAEREVA